jgi:hypothetical protein
LMKTNSLILKGVSKTLIWLKRNKLGRVEIPSFFSV